MTISDLSYNTNNVGMVVNFIFSEKMLDTFFWSKGNNDWFSQQVRKIKDTTAYLTFENIYESTFATDNHH